MVLHLPSDFPGAGLVSHVRHSPTPTRPREVRRTSRGQPSGGGVGGGAGSSAPSPAACLVPHCFCRFAVMSQEKGFILQ